MIKSMRIKNFQIHEDIALEFSNKINVIAGTSGAGKSAVRRAIEWVKNNKPSGDDIKNWNSKEDDSVEVEIKTSDKVIINKTRTNKKSSYFIDDNLPLSAIKQDVPEEVRDALNILDFNIQGQHEKYFLVQESPGERAKQLNAFVGLDAIDVLFSNLNTKINTTNRELTSLENEKKDLIEKQKDFSELNNIEKTINSITLYFSLSEKFENIISGIENFITSIEKIKEEIKEYDNLISMEKEVNQIFDLISKEKEIDYLRTQIEISISNIQEKEEEIKDYESIIDAEEEVNALIERIDRYMKIDKEEKDLLEAITNIEDINDGIKIHSNTLTSLEKKLNSLLKDLGMCPFCGSKIKSIINKGR